MNTKHLKYLWAILIAVPVSGLYSCNNNPDKISNYTPGNEKDTTHVSGGIVKTSRGEEIFMQRCIACHGQGGDSRKMNAANLQISLIDSSEIARTIRQGRNQMPMFSSDAIPDSDLAQVELYVKTLRK
jgi:mono/diheme cytochrome c family protein